LKNLNKDSAPGNDKIPGSAWFNLDGENEREFLKVFNEWWRDAVNIARVIPIFKKGDRKTGGKLQGNCIVEHLLQDIYCNDK
jgi:hypothetical protein